MKQVRQIIFVGALVGLCVLGLGTHSLFSMMGSNVDSNIGLNGDENVKLSYFNEPDAYEYMQGEKSPMFCSDPTFDLDKELTFAAGVMKYGDNPAAFEPVTSYEFSFIQKLIANRERAHKLKLEANPSMQIHRGAQKSVRERVRVFRKRVGRSALCWSLRLLFLLQGKDFDFSNMQLGLDGY